MRIPSFGGRLRIVGPAFILLALPWLLLATPDGARGQTGHLYGTVTGDQGEALPGLTVTLSGSGPPRIQVTDAQGQFRFPDLPGGEHQLQAELEGFSPVEYPSIRIRDGRSTTLEVTLSPSVEEEITAAVEAGDGISWYAGISWDGTNWLEFEDVSGADDATSFSNGVGAYLGVQVGDTPLWAGVEGHYTTLQTETAIDGSRIEGDIDYYSLGPTVRYPFGEGDWIPWIGLGGLYTWNRGKFDLINGVVETEDRTHETWRAELSGGLTHWVRPRVGLDLSLGYSTTFDDEDADEHIRVSAGFIYNGGNLCGGKCGGTR